MCERKPMCITPTAECRTHTRCATFSSCLAPPARTAHDPAQPVCASVLCVYPMNCTVHGGGQWPMLPIASYPIGTLWNIVCMGPHSIELLLLL